MSSFRVYSIYRQKKSIVRNHGKNRYEIKIQSEQKGHNYYCD